MISDLIVALKAEADAGHTGDYEAWVEFLAGIKKTYPLGYDKPADGGLAPQYVIERLGAIAGPDAIYTSGVGQHQMWAAQFVGYEKPEHLDQLRRPRHHGLLRAGRDGRQGRHARLDRVGDRRRRLLPDDQPGARHLRDQRHPDQGRDHQQRVARHGAPVADALLQRALLQHRPALQADPGLRQARRGLRLRRAWPATSPDDVDATITKAMEINDVPVVVDFRVHRDAMVWPMVAAGTSNDDIKYARDLAPAVRGRRRTWSSARDDDDRAPSTRCPSWSRTSPACWPGSPASSAAAASTSTRSRSARPSTPRSPG